MTLLHKAASKGGYGEGVTEGVTEGEIEGVTEGVTAAGDSDGEGVTLIDVVIEGVTLIEGEIEGVTDGDGMVPSPIIHHPDNPAMLAKLVPDPPLYILVTLLLVNAYPHTLTSSILPSNVCPKLVGNALATANEVLLV